MTSTKLAFILALAVSVPLAGLAQETSQDTNAAVSPMQSLAISPVQQTAGLQAGVGGFTLPPLSLKCLEWHCQGSECICLRITTAE